MKLSGKLLNPVARRLRTHPQLGRMALRCLPDHRRVIEVKAIGPLAIRNRRHRAYWLRGPTWHERFPLGALRACITPDDVVWDIGSNIGMYARFEVQAFGASHVCAFEPMSENLALLRENIERGGIAGRVTIVPVAVGDRDARMQLQIDDVQSATAVLDAVAPGRASQGRSNLGLPPKTEEVQVRTIDSLIAEGVLPEPTIVKIDVEGAEQLVLEGAREFLEQGQTLYLIELHGIEPGRAVGRHLLDLGYTLRGRVRENVDPSQYVPVTQGLLDGLQGRNDLQFIVASRDPSRVPEAVPLFE